MQIFRDTIRVDRDNIGNFIEMTVFFSNEFGDLLAKELQFNRGHVNDGIIKYYSDSKIIHIDMSYFEENEDEFDTLHYSILKLELLTADTKLELVNFIKKNFN